jgi:hypothetical protein
VKAATLCGLVLLFATSAAPAPPWRGTVFGLLHGENRSLKLFLLRDVSFGTFYVRAPKIQLVLRPLDSTGVQSLLPNASGAIAAIAGSPCRGPRSSEDPCFYGTDFLVELTFSLPPSDRGAFELTLNADNAAYASGASSIAVGSDVTPPLLYVPQLPDDVGLRIARKRYLGRTVYALPVAVERALHCSGAPSQFQDIPSYHTAIVTAIERTNGTAEIGHFQSADGDFLAIQPLLVTISAPEQRAVFPPWFPSVRTPPPGSCAQRYTSMADPWEIERNFALRDPRDHPEWPARFREALAQRRILVGMTHEMVASVLGYPAQYGTVAQLDRLAKWDYDAPTPFQSSVTFRDDRVVKYEPPGNLP